MLERPNSPKREQVISLRKAGLTYAEIGRRLGLSRERVRQLDKGISPQKKSRPDFGDILMVGEVARMLGVHINTVRRWSNKGILEAYSVGPRGDRRFKRADIDRFLLKKSSARTR